MKVKLNYTTDNLTNAQDLKIGDLLEIVTGEYKGEVILKTFECFVQLSDPSNTWNLNTSGLLGRKLLPGESITLTVENE